MIRGIGLSVRKWLWILVVLVPSPASMPGAGGNQSWTARLAELDAIERQVDAYQPRPEYPDDVFVKVTLKEAIAGAREQNGGIGACLVRAATGEIVERGHNRQFEPYLRSDLHAEMDLLNRYEDRVRGSRSRGGASGDPRKIEGLVLYSSLEPCPMCLARIINAGLKKTFFAAADPAGGMVQRFRGLPPFWQEKAAGNTYAGAACAPELAAWALRIFGKQGGPATTPP